MNAPRPTPSDAPENRDAPVARIDRQRRSRAGRRIVTFGAVGIALVALAWFGWTEVRSRTLIDVGTGAYNRGDFTRALRAAQEQLALRPRDRRGSLLAAKCLSRMRQADLAETYYRFAGEIGLEDSHLRGIALIDAQRADLAIAVYHEILRRWPRNVLALRRLAGVYLSRGRWPEALAQAEVLIQIPSAEVIGQTLAGSVRHNQSEHRLAVAAFQRVLELDPELREMPLSPQSLFWDHYARDLLADGRTAAAREVLERALARQTDASLLDLMGQAHKAEGHLDEAEKCWQQSLAIDPRIADPWLNLGRLALQRRQLTEAVRLLSQACELSPDSVDPLFNLAQAHRLLGNTGEANRLQRRVDELRQTKRQDTSSH